MNGYIVEDGFPVPNVIRKSRRDYPWKHMDIGQSVFIQNGDISAVSSAYSYGRRHNLRFISKKTDEGTRIWRIS